MEKAKTVVVYRNLFPQVIRVRTAGPPGPAGASGPQWRGEWSEDADYAPQDLVRIGDDLWIAKRPNRGERPGQTDAWEPFLEINLDVIDGGEL